MKQGNFDGSAQLDLNIWTELQHTCKTHKWTDRNHGQACMAVLVLCGFEHMLGRGHG